MPKKWSLAIVAMILVMMMPSSIADVDKDTVGVYANDIDWNLCKDYFEGGYNNYVRVKDPYMYEKTLILGGHKAQTDANMPTNLADAYLPKDHKTLILENDKSFCFKMLVHRPGTGNIVELMFFCGSDRENTLAQCIGDLDLDGVMNCIEAINNTDIHMEDTDGDGFIDGFETIEKGAFYDPLVHNNIYLLVFDVNGRDNSIEYQNFLWDMTGASMSQYNGGNACTEKAMVDFFNKVRDEAQPECSIFYIDINATYRADGFWLSDNFITIDEFDDMLDSIDCIKYVNFANVNGGAVDLDNFDGGSGKVICNTDMLKYLHHAYKEGRCCNVDTNVDGYVSLAELINDYIAREAIDPSIALRSPLGGDIERVLTPGLFQFGVRVSF